MVVRQHPAGAGAGARSIQVWSELVLFVLLLRAVVTAANIVKTFDHHKAHDITSHGLDNHYIDLSML